MPTHYSQPAHRHDAVLRSRREDVFGRVHIESVDPARVRRDLVEEEEVVVEEEEEVVVVEVVVVVVAVASYA